MIAEDLLQRARIPPTRAGLLALSRGAANAWQVVRRDPGLVLLLLQHPPFSPPALIHSAEVLDDAVRRLRHHGESSLVDWTDPRRQPTHSFAVRCAAAAHRLASLTGACDAERAWVTGLLAPLGRLAIAAHFPDEAAVSPEAEHERWGLDQAELSRRLARLWDLPDWLTALLGHLGLPGDVVEQLGAEGSLFRVVQLDGVGALRIGAAAGELLRALGLTAVPTVGDEVPAAVEALTLTEHLAVEADKRRLAIRASARQLEADIDVLHRSLEEQRAREDERLLEQKLRALAEFAAGAGHEINNPLAVISGQAQYLLGHEADAGRRGSLERIIGQTQRIHGLLRELMQFARPPEPVLRSVDLVRIIDEVVTALDETSRQHRVRVLARDGEETHPPVAPPPCLVEVDEKQVRTALTCLVKNALQAAGADGWVRVRLHRESGWVDVRVEDSGPGPGDAQREHLFDPFYSGRSAGRGPGLGLPTAWSLARRQGGEVALVSQPGETTCFVLRLPLPVDLPGILAG